jgi:glucose-1-phosphate thymidylyltransferase
MWGVIPAAGNGTRIQPLAFSKELLPVGSQREDSGQEQPRAVSEYIIERMVRGGATKICFVISPAKTDILQYYGGAVGGASIAYVIQDRPAGLCDAIFRSLPLIDPNEPVIVGLPDTIWFPRDALMTLPDDRLSFLLFPVESPELFDAVETEPDGSVKAIAVKSASSHSSWIWGAFKMPGRLMQHLQTLWLKRECRDQYVGTLVNAFLAEGGVAWASHSGQSYVDVGTLNGYRCAIELLRSDNQSRVITPIGRPSVRHRGFKAEISSPP